MKEKAIELWALAFFLRGSPSETMWEAGEAIDKMAIAAAKEAGIEYSDVEQEVERFDLSLRAH